VQGVAQFHTVTELRHRTESIVLVFADSLAAVIDHFLDHVRPRIRGEAMLGIEILQSGVDLLQIIRPHVLGRVYSEIEDRWDLMRDF